MKKNPKKKPPKNTKEPEVKNISGKAPKWTPKDSKGYHYVW